MQDVSASLPRDMDKVRGDNAWGRAFWPCAIALLGAMAVLQFVTVRQESQIYDESNQLLSGYTYLHSGRFTLGLEHPPLLKLLWAMPVAMLHPNPPPTRIPVDNPWPAGRDFLYRNRVPADSMLMAGRAMAITISALLGVAIAVWTRRQFGSSAALLALIIFACDPNFLANGRYIKNDVGAALMIFLAVMAWGAYLTRPSRRALVIAGIVLGLALTTKFSALVLLPLMPILYLIHAWLNRVEFGAVRFVRPIAAAVAIAGMVVFATYRFEIQRLGDSGVFRNLAPHAPLLLWRLPIPALSYVRGFGEIGVKQMATGNTVSYLMGEHATFGWWYMSPVAFLVKTPLAELMLFSIAAVLAIRLLRRARWREIRFQWFLLTIPPVFFFGVSLFSTFNAGLRHILPVYPFLFVVAAALLLGNNTKRWRWITAASCVALLIGETISVHPHYLAFFNAMAGGPSGGNRYLVDSNLDWGQDVKNLKAYLDLHQVPEVCIDYFGIAELDYYGIRSRPLTPLPTQSAVRNLDCVAAISATKFALEAERYAGLATMEPAAKIGYSIYIYDLRKLAADAGAPVSRR